MVFEKLFGRRRKRKIEPEITFGRYSDNNKTVEKVNRWTDSDILFREEKYQDSMEAFFDYLRDDSINNVVFEKNQKEGKFRFYQGSKIIRGSFDEEQLQAEVVLARMPEPKIPVMRRLLEMNFHLYYSRYALVDDQLCMRFDTPLRTANPNKLYYALKELATKSDKQDDLLVQEFQSLQEIDTAHVEEIPLSEKEIKFKYLHKWLESTFAYVETLDNEKFSGGIAYLLLALIFRIDYLLSPEGKLISELEKIVEKYYKKDDKSTVDKNQQMIDGLNKIKARTKEEIFPYLFRSRHTFSIVSPQTQKFVKEAINTAVQNMYWYRDNNYTAMAIEVLEYGLSYSQFSFSLPKPEIDLYRLFMQINHADFFEELGFAPRYYNATNNKFDDEEIISEINEIVEKWKKKYPHLTFNTRKLRFNTLLNFNYSFVMEMADLNFDS
jgi:hypothetical protein